MKIAIIIIWILSLYAAYLIGKMAGANERQKAMIRRIKDNKKDG